jgi:hypothetical protein
MTREGEESGGEEEEGEEEEEGSGIGPGIPGL